MRLTEPPTVRCRRRKLTRAKEASQCRWLFVCCRGFGTANRKSRKPVGSCTCLYTDCYLCQCLKTLQLFWRLECTDFLPNSAKRQQNVCQVSRAKVPKAWHERHPMLRCLAWLWQIPKLDSLAAVAAAVAAVTGVTAAAVVVGAAVMAAAAVAVVVVGAVGVVVAVVPGVAAAAAAAAAAPLVVCQLLVCHSRSLAAIGPSRGAVDLSWLGRDTFWDTSVGFTKYIVES